MSIHSFTRITRKVFAAVACTAAALAFSIGVAQAGGGGGGGGGGQQGGGDGGAGHPKNDFVIPLNYELGMHCTGFEFAYCCVLPPYNSILAQVIKTEGAGIKQPLILEGDPNVGKDAILKRETVVRDPVLDADGNFKKYVIRYRHEAQDRNGDPNGKPQTSTLISAVELNSMFMWNTIYDRTAKNPNGTLKTGDYSNATNVPIGNINDPGSPGYQTYEANDNYASGWLNHLYLYETNPDGNNCQSENPFDPGDDCHANLEGKGADGDDAHKFNLGIELPIPVDCGPAFHPMGPVTSDIDADTGLPMKDEDGNLITEPNNCGGVANGNLLTFSTDDGTVVYTKANVLDDLPITLTSPRIWEALGLPLTPFEDSIGFFDDPGQVDEDSIRPYVKMIAELEDFHTGAPVLDSKGNPVRAFGTAPIDIPNCERCHSELAATSFNSAQQIGGRNSEVAALVEQETNFWKAYYDINDTELPDGSTVDSTWYARLKGAAISILAIHDNEHGTTFTEFYGTPPGLVGAVNCKIQDPPGGGANWESDNCSHTNNPPGPLTPADGAGAMIPGTDPRAAMPQNTRLGHESVICQKCHADNVIAVVRGASCGEFSGSDDNPCPDGQLIPPVTEALHNNHTNVSEGGVVSFTDSLGRDGGCQGCHPAHRSDGDMAGYPITIEGDNFYQDGDNRLASGGCFVGRDVHSNIYKDTDGAETPEHLNAVGQWLSEYVYNNQGGDQGTRGIWCTNCHTQLSQEIWRTEDCNDLINADCVDDIRNQPSLEAMATKMNEVGGPVIDGDVLIYTEDLLISWLDPKGSICEEATDPALNGRNCNIDADCDDGMCVIKSNDGVDRTHAIWNPDNPDANVATIEVHDGSGDCGDLDSVEIAPGLFLCVRFDEENDVNVNILSFCTTQGTDDSCVDLINANKDDQSMWRYPEDGAVDHVSGFAGTGTFGAPVPFGAATDARDHWLSPGEPHCADCHAAPYTEQSGNINFFAPFNYPAKASLMRYSRGHQDITCQGCHESIHGLYPVTPTIDTTSYAQAAQWNSDDSHGPLKCGTCHTTNSQGVNGAANIAYTDPVTGVTNPDVRGDFDDAVSWMHTYTDEADPRESICLRCHGVKGDDWDAISADSKQWASHASIQRVSRKAMDKAEINTLGHVLGDDLDDPDDPYDTICLACHKDNTLKSGDSIASCSTRWKNHLVEGRVSETVWEKVSVEFAGTTCGW